MLDISIPHRSFASCWIPRTLLEYTIRNFIGLPDGQVYRNKTLPLDGGAVVAGDGVSSFGDSCSLRSFTSGASSPETLVPSALSSSSFGSADGATLRIPPALA